MAGWSSAGGLNTDVKCLPWVGCAGLSSVSVPVLEQEELSVCVNKKSAFA